MTGALRAAVVGARPAGCYTAEQLVRATSRPSSLQGAETDGDSVFLTAPRSWIDGSEVER